jgi:uncharacterized protein YkwD
VDPWGEKMVFLRYLSAAVILIVFFPFSSVDSREAALRSGPSDTEIRDFIRRVNALRQSIGCPELKWDDRIAAVAQSHSRDMVERNFYSHINPDGKDPFDRLDEADIPFSAAAENIASGPKTGKEAYLIWLNSPSHRQNMLDCRFLRHGVGRVRGRWTHILVRPSPDPESSPFFSLSGKRFLLP